MRRTFLTSAVCVLLIVGARDAAAQVGQPWTDLGYFNLNAAFGSGSGTLDDFATFRLYDEDTGTKTVRHGTDSGPLIDFSVGSRVWRNVSVGIGFHRGASNGEAAVDVSVPSPTVFGRNRSATASATDLDRTERAIHLQVGYMIPINDRLSVHVTVGPSFFKLTQEVVSDVTIAEVGFPFTDVNVAPVVTERSDSATGGNIGVDVAYMIYETTNLKLGGGAFVRYSGASTRIIVLESEVKSDVGGVQFGVGARLRF